MVTKRQMSIVMVLISLGLIGPIAFIAQGAATNGTTQTDTVAPTPPPQPVKLTQVKEYTAQVTAEVISLKPTMVILFQTNLTQDNLTSLSNISNATLIDLIPGDNYYSAKYELDSPELFLQTLEQFSSNPVNIVEYGVFADIELPRTFTAYRAGTPYPMSLGANDELQAIVSGITTSGEANFTLKITETGNTKSIIAAEIA